MDTNSTQAEEKIEYVIKADGHKEKRDDSKIQKMADFATEGTNCSSLELQSSLHFSIRDGIKTSFIHAQMRMEAINKISPDQPQWRIVAGRLQTMEDLKRKRKMARTSKQPFDTGADGELNFDKFIHHQITNGHYDAAYFQLKDSHLVELFEMIAAPKKQRNFDYAVESVITLENKFLIGLETPLHLYFVLSLIFAQKYFSTRDQSIYLKKMSGFDNDVLSQAFIDKVQDYFEKASKKQISFPSVILSELRKPNANLSSCFIGKFPDDMDGIMDLVKEFAIISKKGGGIGANLDSIRAFQSWLMGIKGKATGVVPLMKVLNDLMIYVNQSGVKDGAMTTSLSAWHMDVFNFLKTQQLGGEEREKSMDLYLQLVANDEFMRAMERDGDWYLFDPYEILNKFGIDLGKLFGEEFEEAYAFLIEKTKSTSNDPEGFVELYKKVRAKDLFKESLRTSINRGTPYWAFKDNINNVSNMKNAGTIYGLNLCVESFSPFDVDSTHTCTLLSVVHPFINSDEELRDVTRTAIEILDLTVELSTAPTESSRKHNNEIRAVGLGSMGLADWNAANSLSFEMPDHQDAIQARFEKLAYYAVERSNELGEELGNFGKFEESQWKQGEIFGKVLTEIKMESKTDLDWDTLSHKVSKNMRHGYLMAIAPNTTSSSAIGVSSSILPTISKLFIEETKTG
ncbi:MAG: ribonucleoside-diphosphate reductase subunit alpha, partial [Bacteroidetes bacterium]